MSEPTSARCSFCEAPNGERKSVVAGKDAAICNECVVIVVAAMTSRTVYIRLPNTTPTGGDSDE